MIMIDDGETQFYLLMARRCDMFTLRVHIVLLIEFLPYELHAELISHYVKCIAWIAML